MDFSSARYGGGAAETEILPFTLLLLLVASGFILLLPRKYAALPFLLASLTIPDGQVIVVAGLHFTVFRLLILMGWARLIASRLLFNRQKVGFRISSIDRAVIWCTIVNVVAFTLRYLDIPAFINRIGFVFNTMGSYFLLRFLIRDWNDADRLLKLFSLICAALAVLMIVEQETGRNLFAVFGGVPGITAVREGRIRSQGPFAHPIIAGTFGATLFPLFLGMWWARKNSKMLSVLGMLSAIVMTITSASSTPIFALAAGIVACLFWPFRGRMRQFRWCLLIMLVGLHLVMKAPVWALIGRVDLVGGSSGWHREELINQAILHFREWWLLGTKDTEHWGYFLHDTANQYVDTAVTSGVFGLALFITILVRCFRNIGLARKAAQGNSKLEFRRWAMGACLFANVLAFVGMSYFDQTIVYLYTIFVLICVMTGRRFEVRQWHRGESVRIGRENLASPSWPISVHPQEDTL
jgi:hypothetical protein